MGKGSTADAGDAAQKAGQSAGSRPSAGRKNRPGGADRPGGRHDGRRPGGGGQKARGASAKGKTGKTGKTGKGLAGATVGGLGKATSSAGGDVGDAAASGAKKAVRARPPVTPGGAARRLRRATSRGIRRTAGRGFNGATNTVGQLGNRAQRLGGAAGGKGDKGGSDALGPLSTGVDGAGGGGAGARGGRRAAGAAAMSMGVAGRTLGATGRMAGRVVRTVGRIPFVRVALVIAALLILLLVIVLASVDMLDEDNADVWDDDNGMAELYALCEGLLGDLDGSGSATLVSGEEIDGLPSDFDMEAALQAFLAIETTWIDGEPNWNNTEGGYWGAYQFNTVSWTEAAYDGEPQGDPQYLNNGRLDPSDMPPPEAQHDFARRRIATYLRRNSDLPWDVVVPVLWMPGPAYIGQLSDADVSDDNGQWANTVGKNPSFRNYRQLWVNGYDQARNGEQPTHDSISPPSGNYIDNHESYTPVGESQGTADGSGSGTTPDAELAGVCGPGSGTPVTFDGECPSGAPHVDPVEQASDGVTDTMQGVVDAVRECFGGPPGGAGNCFNPRDGSGEHPRRRACDFMVCHGCDPGESSTEYEWGQTMALWLIANSEDLGPIIVIWDDRIWSTSRDGDSTALEREYSYSSCSGCGRVYCSSGGDNTLCHRDHVHVSVRYAPGDDPADASCSANGAWACNE